MSQDEDDNDQDDDSAVLPQFSDESRADDLRVQDGNGSDSDNTAVGSEFTFEPSSSAADDNAAADQST